MLPIVCTAYLAYLLSAMQHAIPSLLYMSIQFVKPEKSSKCAIAFYAYL